MRILAALLIPLPLGIFAGIVSAKLNDLPVIRTTLWTCVGLYGFALMLVTMGVLASFAQGTL